MAAPLACGSPCLLGGRVRARNPGGVRTKGREKLREASLPPPSPPPPLRARSSSFKPGWPEWSQLSPGSRRARKWPRGRSHSPQTNEFKGATEEAPAKESPHTGEFKGAALVSPISKRMLERLSKFEVGDAENVASYDSKIKKIVHQLYHPLHLGL
ncbi:putative tyrosine-protein phosphatase TPTE isoform X3 [Pan paniscus]|uniref:putative tyrosine-protein phosphatase TPTE isoform X3 n=1 Tax=Pan paniscus TaxID=9597 RepID=UPI0015605D25